MTQLYFKSADLGIKEVELDEGESVLNGLLRSGVDVPYGCRTGVCQSCMLQSQDTEVPSDAQKGLREAQKQQGYFLSCCCQPDKPMIVKASDYFKKERAELLEKKLLSSQVVRLRIKKVISYRPGQYVTLWKDADTARTYSLVSHPGSDDFLEFHVRLYDNGVFSSWAFNVLKEGDELEIQGPMGDCFYTPTDKTQSLFLSGLGTGLAPLYGVARDALLQGHTGPILLLIGAKTQSGLYYEHELAELAAQYPQLQVRYSIQELPPELNARRSREADIYSTANMLMPDFSGVRVFLCGGANFVQKMRKQCFLAGANMGDIVSDTFLCFPKD